MPLSGEAIRPMNYIDDVAVTLRRVLAFIPTLTLRGAGAGEVNTLGVPSQTRKTWPRHWLSNPPHC